MTANYANTQLRNAQLPGNVVSLYACAKFYVSGVYAFACAFTFVRVFVFLQHLSFTGESRVLGDYPASKNTEQLKSEVILSYIALVLTTV